MPADRGKGNALRGNGNALRGNAPRANSSRGCIRAGRTPGRHGGGRGGRTVGGEVER